jgi:hypothetical protein
MDTSRSLFQVIWLYLRPKTQMQIRMTCSNLRKWSEEWPINVPKLEEFKAPSLYSSSTSDWAIESKSLKINNHYIPGVYRWGWVYGSLCVKINFIKCKETFLLVSIHVQYERGCHKDCSFASISFNSFVWKWQPNMGKGGKSMHRLPNNKYSSIFKELRTKVIQYCGDSKIKKLLFPYCSHMFHRGNSPKTVEWNKSNKIYTCNECEKRLKDFLTSNYRMYIKP